MKFKRINIIFILGITLLTVTFQKVGAIEHSPIYLGRMYIGNVYAVKNNDGKLGIEIHKKAETFLKQSFPVQIQVYFNEFEIKNVCIGYDSIDNNYQCFTGYSSFKVNENTFFNIVDEWRITANFMDLSRSVIVKGNSEGGSAGRSLSSTASD